MTVQSCVRVIYQTGLALLLVWIVQILPRGNNVSRGCAVDCILNYCRDQIASDIAIMGFYATAVGAMIVFAILSQSRTIQTAALMIAGVWLISIICFLIVAGQHYYVLSLAFDAVLAFEFWRMAQKEIFPLILCLLMIGEIAFLVGAAAISLDAFWTMFILNRIFEATLAYIIGCSIFRIRKLKAPENDSNCEADPGLKFIAG